MVGNSIEAKCAVGNALLCKKNLFRILSCRRECVARTLIINKTVQTLSGRRLVLNVTPNLNTPFWECEAKGIIKKYNDYIFVYVKSPDVVSVNDDKSIESLKKEYPNKNVFICTYYKKAPQAEYDSLGPVLHSKVDLLEFANNALNSIGNIFRKETKLAGKEPWIHNEKSLTLTTLGKEAFSIILSLKEVITNY